MKRKWIKFKRTINQKIVLENTEINFRNEKRKNISPTQNQHVLTTCVAY
jgi:hypothetical protein